MDEDLKTLEAALYAAGRPLTIEEMSELIDKTETSTRELAEELGYQYHKRDGALEVVELPRDRFVLQLKPKLTPRVGSLIPGGLLSFATLQTLVYIALKQPILQSEVVSHRGTHCYEHINRLEELKFLESKPHGRTKMLKTTGLFADYFGLHPDKVKMKAQLKHKMKKILAEQKAREEGSIT
ncbi:MAG: SMC-Scp complex subunit ScpB [Candidatus Thorarchaeota archaeon]